MKPGSVTDVTGFPIYTVTCARVRGYLENQSHPSQHPLGVLIAAFVQAIEKDLNARDRCDLEKLSRVRTNTRQHPAQHRIVSGHHDLAGHDVQIGHGDALEAEQLREAS
jgi:hypothetical protein